MNSSAPDVQPARSALLRAPSTIAVVGASRVGGSYYGSRLLSNLISGGTRAQIYPVNPRYAGEDVQGFLAYSSIDELPAVPDLIALTTAPAASIVALEQAAKRGVPAAIVMTAEQGAMEERRAFDAAIARISRESGMAIVGPNSMGMFNGRLSLNCSFASGALDGALPIGGTGMVSQSGAVISYMLQAMHGTSFGCSWLVSTGNEAAMSLEALFEAVVEDPETENVMLFVEGVSDGARFRRAALRAQALGKPVAMLKAGVSDSGREAVQSHTGRIAGAKEVYEALADETGIYLARSFEDFFYVGHGLAAQVRAGRKARPARRALVVTSSGGAASVTADHLTAAGWTLPRLAPGVAADLEEISGQKEVANPFDVTGSWGDPTLLPRIIGAMSKQDDVDAVFITTGAGGRFGAGVAEALAPAIRALPIPVYIGWVGILPQTRKILDDAGVSIFDDPARAVRVADAAARLAEADSRVADARAMLGVLGQGEAAGSGGEGLWTVVDTLDDVRAAGFPCAPYRVAGAIEPEAVADLADACGYPVVLKLVSSELNHKSDKGGVRLNVRSRDEVVAAVAGFSELASREGISGARVLVQKMVSGLEVLIGVKRDPAFGPLLVLGLGGTSAELFDDATATLLPASRSALERMVDRHGRLCRMLEGFRGSARIERRVLVDLLEIVARWVAAKGPELQEADFNPVMLTPDGGVFVDGRVVWGRRRPERDACGPLSGRARRSERRAPR